MCVRQNRPFCCDFAVLVIGCLIPITLASARAEEGETNKQQRLDFIRARLGRFEVETVEEPAKSLTFSAEPVLWYTNPVRSASGTGATFFWLDGVRPVAAMSASIRDGGKVFRELTLLKDVRLRATRDSKVVWSPKAIGKPWAVLPETPPPGKSESLRLIQMRSIVRRFEARLLKGDMESGSLRALSKPIYRYADAEMGVLDGAVFAMVEATDPEGLLLLEAKADDAGGSWQYTLARMTSRPSEVLLNGRELWNTHAYWKNPRSNEDPYCEAYEGQYEEEAAEVTTRKFEVSR